MRNLEAHAEHFSTWSIDMLGHGYTDKPGHPLEIGRYVSHLMAVFDAIGADKAHLAENRWADGWRRGPPSITPAGSTGWCSTLRAARRPTLK